MATFISASDLASWLGVSVDATVTRLAAVANQAVSDYVDRDDVADLEGNAACIQAALETAGNLYRNRTLNPMVASIVLGDGQITYRDLTQFETIPPTAKALLRPYRRFHVYATD